LEAATDLDERINQVLAKDWSGMGIDDRLRYLKDRLIYLPTEGTYTRPYTIDRFPVFRARSGIDERIENVRLARTFSYPNSSALKTPGRANVEYCPVFYSSDNLETAVAEIQPRPDEVVYVSEWIIRCGRPCFYGLVTPRLTTHPANDWLAVVRMIRENRIKWFTEWSGPNLAEKVERIMDFIAERFVAERHPYPISSAIGAKLLYGHTLVSVDYLVYPSVQNVTHTCNIAFNPNFVDEFFKIDKVFRLQIKDPREHGAVIAVTAIAEYDGQFLEWRLPTKEEAEKIGKAPEGSTLEALNISSTSSPPSAELDR
jgi:hypothetical protein